MYFSLENLNQRNVSWFVFLTSLLISGWAILIDPVINQDGVRYVAAAQRFSEGDFDGALFIYKWPFYSFLIGGFSWLTGIAPEPSAHVINALLIGFAGIAFIRISGLLGAKAGVLLLAAIVFLAFPGLNEVRSYVIRGFGFWACFLWMTFYFQKMLINPDNRNTLRFILFGSLASAFRIEGIVFLLGLPIIYLFSGTVKNHLKAIGYFLVFAVVPLLGFFLLTWVFNKSVGESSSEMALTFEQAVSEIKMHLINAKEEQATGILAQFPVINLVVASLMSIVKAVAEILSFGYLLILLLGWLARPYLNTQQASARLVVIGWLWIIFLNSTVLFSFFLLKSIITDRYPISLTLLLMLVVAFSLNNLYTRFIVNQSESRKRFVISCVAVLLGLNTLEGLDGATSKHYLKEAGEWIDERVDENAKVFSNDPILHYYTGTRAGGLGHKTQYQWKTAKMVVSSKVWKEYDYLALKMSPDMSVNIYHDLYLNLGQFPTHTVDGDDGKRVLIYQVDDK